MDVTCLGCEKPIPDFARVCPHCGHRMAERRLIPALALSWENEPDREPVLTGFDFAPDEFPAADAPPPAFAEEAFADEVHSFPEEVHTLAEDDWPPSLEAEPTAAQAPATAEPSSAFPAEAQVSVRGNGPLFGPSSDTPAPAAVEQPRSKHRDIVFVTLAAAISGIVTLGWLVARTAPGPEVAVAAATESTPAAVSPTAKTATVPASRTYQWTSANSAVWAGDMKNAVAFELEAENTIGVWMRTVRPALILRCSGGSIEAFVFTASAARLEPNTDDHTVEVSFDGAATSIERWRDSEEHDALFAPAGTAFVQQLTGARVMRFGFTPHNAAPVTAEFNVAGLSAVLASAARTCGIKQ